jgi:hypothetical protein
MEKKRKPAEIIFKNEYLGIWVPPIEETAIEVEVAKDDNIKWEISKKSAPASDIIYTGGKKRGRRRD